MQIRRAIGDKAGITASLSNLASVLSEQGATAAARQLYAETITLAEELDDQWGIMIALNNLGLIAVREQRFAEAQRLHAQSLKLAQALGDQLLMAYGCIGLAGVAAFAITAATLAVAQPSAQAPAQARPQHMMKGPQTRAEVTAKVVRTVKHRHRLTGVVAPATLHASIAEALSGVGLLAVDHVHELGHDDVPLFGPEAVKGLEFDGVVVVNPHGILDGSTRGARLLYVAMTRAVQELAFVASDAAPAVIA